MSDLFFVLRNFCKPRLLFFLGMKVGIGHRCHSPKTKTARTAIRQTSVGNQQCFDTFLWLKIGEDIFFERSQRNYECVSSILLF